jgi:hypothetical protein
MEQKDITIKNIVRLLQSQLGVDNIIIKDYWDADNFAIGLTDKDRKNVVYISTWKKKSNEFYLSLECPSDNENENYTECGEFDNTNIDKTLEIVKQHLIKTTPE